VQNTGALNMPNKIQLEEYSTGSGTEGILYISPRSTAGITSVSSMSTATTMIGMTTGGSLACASLFIS